CARRSNGCGFCWLRPTTRSMSAPAITKRSWWPTSRGVSTEASADKRRDVGFGLTAGQAEVLMLRATGPLRDAIADELDISIDTVKTQLRHAYRKTGVRTANEATRWWNDHPHELTIEPCPLCGRLT